MDTADPADQHDSPMAAPPPAVRIRSLPPEAMAEIAALARKQREAGGILLHMITAAGGTIENGLEKLPDGVKNRIEAVTHKALTRGYRLAARTGPRVGGPGAATHRAAATVSGALGGIGGIATALVELPVTITVILRALQQIAVENGFDPSADETLADCLQVFASGGPLASDDAINTSFLTARMTITGVTLQRLIAKVASPLAVVLGQKLAAQTVPVLGAAAGASINFAFVGYYQEMARVRFGLKRLARDHDPAAVAAAFAMAVGPKRLS